MGCANWIEIENAETPPRVVYGRTVFGSRGVIEVTGSASEPFPFDGTPSATATPLYQIENTTAVITGDTYQYMGLDAYLHRSTSHMWFVAGIRWDNLGDPVNTDNAGSVDVFDLATGSTKLYNLPNPTPLEDDGFGEYVAIDGDKLIVGAPRNDGYLGGAWVFDLPTGNLLQTFTPPDTAHAIGQFGGAVAISGNTAIIGAANAGTGYFGEVYIMDVITGNVLHTFANPEQVDTGDYFGLQVAIDGDIAVVTAERRGDGVDIGRAWVLDVASGSVLQTLDPWTNNGFGTAVDISADYIAIGQDNFLSNGLPGGGVHFYDRNTLPATPTFTIGNPTADNCDFGFAVKMDGDYVAIGNPSREQIYIYRISDQTQIGSHFYPGSTNSSGYGRVALIYGSLFGTTAYYDGTNDSGNGQVYTYQ